GAERGREPGTAECGAGGGKHASGSAARQNGRAWLPRRRGRVSPQFSPMSFSPIIIVGSATAGPPASGIDRHGQPTKQSEVVMKRYIIEREIPGVGGLSDESLKGTAGQSNPARSKTARKAPKIPSHVADNKTFCISSAH